MDNFGAVGKSPCEYRQKSNINYFRIRFESKARIDRALQTTFMTVIEYISRIYIEHFDEVDIKNNLSKHFTHNFERAQIRLES